MELTDLEKAREWAEGDFDQAYIHAGPRAAAEVIQSLPDSWVDAEKVAELADDMANWSLPDMLSTTESVCRHLIETIDGFADRINDLLTPPLPTLADMTPEEREACQWMQAQTWHEVGIILWVDEASEIAQLITRSNGVLERKFKDATPLPDLPRLEWPAQEPRNPENPPAETVDTPRSDTPRNPRPEDVPAGEPWIVEHYGHRWVGTREESRDTIYTWALARFDGAEYSMANDVDITLVSRLVPEHKENA